ELIGDRIENGAYHAFDLTLRELGKIGAQLLHQLGTDHLQPRCGFVLASLWTGPLPQTREPLESHAVRKPCVTQGRSEGGVPQRNAAFRVTSSFWAWFPQPQPSLSKLRPGCRRATRRSRMSHIARRP